MKRDETMTDAKGAAGSCIDPGTGELLAAYELGLLDATERARFEAHLHECAFCAEDLYANAPYAAALREHAGEIAGPAGVREVPGPSRPGSLRAILGALLLPRILVPAAVAVLLVTIFLSQHPSSPGRFAQLAQVEPVAYVPLATRAGALPEAERLYRGAMTRYANGEYEEAARQLEEALAAGGEAWDERDPTAATQAHFYLGSSRLLLRDAEGALPHLDAAMQSDLPVVADRARWFAAQAHLLLDEPVEAAVLLRRLAGKSPAYGDRAQGELDALAALGVDPH